jgi:hypothetical protein
VDATPDLIAKWTSEFLRRKTTHPVYSTAEVEGPLTAAGFSVSISREPSEGSWRMGVVAIKRS